MSTDTNTNWKETNPKDALGSGRVPMGLFPDTAVIAGSMAFLEGALKYEPYNWRRAGVRASIYVEALRRHMAAWWNGEDMDHKSGLNHLWKALACLAILIDAQEYGMLTDDRSGAVEFVDPVIDGMLERLQKDVAEMKARVLAASGCP